MKLLRVAIAASFMTIAPPAYAGDTYIDSLVSKLQNYGIHQDAPVSWERNTISWGVTRYDSNKSFVYSDPFFISQDGKKILGTDTKNDWKEYDAKSIKQKGMSTNIYRQGFGIKTTNVAIFNLNTTVPGIGVRRSYVAVGNRTQDMPRNLSASYNGYFVGRDQTNSILNGNAKISVDPAKGIEGYITGLRSMKQEFYLSFRGSQEGANFGGSVTRGPGNTGKGLFVGSFYGPQAKEIGGSLEFSDKMNGNNLDIIGSFAGKRK